MKTKQKAQREWAIDMRARAVVAAWLTKIGKAPPEKGLKHIQFATQLRAILDPTKREASFQSKREAKDYVREVAMMVGGRDSLAPPKTLSLAAQKRARDQRADRKQRVADAKRWQAKKRILVKIEKADRETAARMQARREERYGST